MITVYLVVTLSLNDTGAIKLEDRQMESIAACVARAAELLHRVEAVMGEDGWELSAACSVAKMPETPAREK